MYIEIRTSKCDNTVKDMHRQYSVLDYDWKKVKFVCLGFYGGPGGEMQAISLKLQQNYHHQYSHNPVPMHVYIQRRYTIKQILHSSHRLGYVV